MARTVRRFSVKESLRKHIIQLKPYTPIDPFDVVAERIGKPADKLVKLDANENLYGPPPEVFQQLKGMEFMNIYPDPETRKLRRRLSEWTGVPMENLLVRRQDW